MHRAVFLVRCPLFSRCFLADARIEVKGHLYPEALWAELVPEVKGQLYSEAELVPEVNGQLYPEALWAELVPWRRHRERQRVLVL